MNKLFTTFVCLVALCSMVSGCSTKKVVKPVPVQEESFTLSELRTLGKQVHFDFDKSTIKEEDIVTLKSKAIVLKAKKGICTVIYGNTDPVGGEKYNYELGLRRAQAVKDFLVSEGVDESKIQVKSLGEFNPVSFTDNNSPESHALDRRDDFVIEVK